MPSFQPYWGKPAVRNDRGDRGDVGIIRSPVRASILPDCGGRPVMGVPTAIARETDVLRLEPTVALGSLGLANNLYTQIGIVLLIALSCRERARCGLRRPVIR